ncbi:Vps5 C terminal like-domain-containing protein [Boletus edulis]|uniref:Vps5 C terminal like-domain-containing protein n=1 Tax=Boletus edulis BED1 TaxID=1328754 RepID=A0AAD4GJJ7_BOLED|nr:Vps5 C terminal like-domain-containing protein [Boletus edulis]KAF8448966.1 Vps5 C terminal like-domain-containing protein [Boletus edulis BED1]
MDGFDDLLAPSQSILEENPFEDPFAKPRSGSPDPWSSFGQQRHSLPSHSDIDYFKSGFEDYPSTTQTTESSFTSDYGHSEQSSAAAPADPLDAATVTAEDHEDGQGATHGGAHPDTTTSRTPGFGVFTSSAEDQSESQVVVGSGSNTPIHDKAPLIAPADESSTAVASLLRVEEPTPSQLSSPQETISSSPERAIVSPLDQQPPPDVDRAFANLALGGESLGGWQTGWSGYDHGTTPTILSTPSATTNDDDDDDTPIGQTARFRNAGSPQSSGSPVASKRSEGPIPPLFVISVEDPQKVGDPIRAHTLYTVHTRTSSPLFSKASFSVLRRYSDFLWLYETLSMNNPGVVVPPAPEKNPFGRFDEQFVQQRRLALEKCIRKMADHPVLCKDPDFKFFLENDNFVLDIKQRRAEMTHEKGGLMASIGQTLTGPRFHETDEWFDKQRVYLDGLESQLRGLVKSIEIVAKQRAELASATSEFAMAIAELSASDLGERLQQTLGTLANVEQAASEAQKIQSHQDMMTLMSTADEYSRLINSVRLAFNSRVRTYTNWQNADAEVRRARQIHERVRAQGRVPTERMGHTVSLVAEAERRALDAKHEFDQCSKLIKSEMARFQQERIDDFKDALQAFLNGMISRQRELISAWENYQQMLLKGADKGVVVGSTSDR